MYYSELKRARDLLTGPGGDFEIVKAVVRGNEINTFKNAPKSVREFWLSSAQFAERPYIIYEDERLSYGETHKLAASVAAWLFAQGVNPGDRIAISMRNYPEWMVIYWGCLSVGITVVGMNAWWTAEEMSYGLKDAAPKVLFLDSERLERFKHISDVDPEMKVVGVRLPEYDDGVIPWSDVAAHGGDLPEVDVDPDSDASIFYTSGTTGFPKGAQLTHRGCIANLMNMAYAAASSALATQMATGEAPPAEMPIPKTLLTTPLFHVTANNCGAYNTTAAGGAMYLMYRWDAGEALKLVEAEKLTGISGVPVMSRELINHPDFATTDTSSLLALSGGGAQVPPDLVQKIEDKVVTARPATGYGMTETCGIITSIAGDFFVDKPDSAGPYMPSFEAKCVDDDGNTVPQGELGELWVKGSPVIKGYLNRPEATAETITDGWLHTGDIARIDENGFIYIVDRKKDMVLRGGENVYCAEVEATLYRHAAVAECCVFGVPDERLGEEVAAAVVLKPGESADAVTIQNFCRELIAKHKVPKFIFIQDELLPRNASGKFLKKDIRAKLIETMMPGVS